MNVMRFLCLDGRNARKMLDLSDSVGAFKIRYSESISQLTIAHLDASTASSYRGCTVFWSRLTRIVVFSISKEGRE